MRRANLYVAKPRVALGPSWPWDVSSHFCFSSCFKTFIWPAGAPTSAKAAQYVWFSLPLLGGQNIYDKGGSGRRSTRHIALAPHYFCDTQRGLLGRCEQDSRECWWLSVPPCHLCVESSCVLTFWVCFQRDVRHVMVSWCARSLSLYQHTPTPYSLPLRSFFTHCKQLKSSQISSCSAPDQLKQKIFFFCVF